MEFLGKENPKHSALIFVTDMVEAFVLKEGAEIPPLEPRQFQSEKQV
jgi:hypothetical protein